MLSEIIHAEINQPTDLALIESHLQRIREHLENEKVRIFQEIRHYPPPIPACDVQFNYLLEERTRICHELGQVQEFLKKSLTSREQRGLFDEFILSSTYSKGAFEQGIRDAVTNLPIADGYPASLQ